MQVGSRPITVASISYSNINDGPSKIDESDANPILSSFSAAVGAYKLPISGSLGLGPTGPLRSYGLTTIG